jgi:crotonobetainyl-CoA:carnitine CoA-transferase CaiB-like acyl-CoA transferase
MMSITGTAESAPLKAGPPVADYGAGLAASFGIATALFERERSGKGQHVDVSMLDAAIVMMGNIVTEVLTARSTPKPQGNNSPPETFGNACFRCADGGIIAIAALEDHHLANLWSVLGRKDIPADPRFSDSDACRRNVAQLHEEMGRNFRERDAQEWEDLLNAADVPAMRVRSIPEALQQPQLKGRDLLHTLEAVPGISGTATIPLLPFMLSAGGAKVESPPPLLGAHTDQVLKALGYSADRITVLRSKGVL